MGCSRELRTILPKLETKQFYHRFPVNFVLINAKHCQLWLLFPKSQRKVYIYVKENKIQLFVMGVWELVGELCHGVPGSQRLVGRRRSWDAADVYCSVSLHHKNLSSNGNVPRSWIVKTRRRKNLNVVWLRYTHCQVQ